MYVVLYIIIYQLSVIETRIIHPKNVVTELPITIYIFFQELFSKEEPNYILQFLVIYLKYCCKTFSFWTEPLPIRYFWMSNAFKMYERT